MNNIVIDHGNGYAELVAEFPTLKNFRPVWLGNYNRLVVTMRQGVYFARQINGQIITVLNDAAVAPIPDLPVIVGQTTDGWWHICRARERYL